MDFWDARERVDALLTEVAAELGRLERAARVGEPLDLQWYRSISAMWGHLVAASAVAQALIEAQRWTVTEEVNRG